MLLLDTQGQVCGLTSQVTFFVTSLECATQYSWAAPSGWSIYYSENNGVTLTPNGSNGGVLQVTISLSTGKTLVRNYTISFINSISNPGLTSSSSQSEICPGESWTFTCIPPPGYPNNYGFDWYATGGLLINGITTTSSTPLHTISNSVTVSATSNSFGAAQVYARVNINNALCNPSAYVYKPIQVGTINSSQFSISGPDTACPNSWVSYLSNYIDPSITNYLWSWSSDFISASGQGTPYLDLTTGYNFTSGTITLRLGNRCGLTGSPAIKYVYSAYCGYSYSISPNPASSTLTVAIVDDQNEEVIPTENLPPNSDKTTVTLVNDRSRAVSAGNLSKGKISFDVSGLPNGLYVIKINAEGKITSRNVLISH